MSSTAPIPQGFLGNLNEEQKQCLKEIWVLYFAVGDKGADPFDPSTAPNKGVAADLTSTRNVLTELGAEKFYSTFWGSPLAEHPDSVMLRFLRARKWDVNKAFAMLATMIKWRVDFDVDSIVARGEAVLNTDLKGFDLQMKSGKAYMHGADKKNRPIFYIHVKIHETKQQAFEVLRAFTIYCMETCRQFLTPPDYQACLVFDLRDFGLKNMDWPFVKFLVQAFEAYYPETLGLLVIHGAPWVFSGLWRAINPLLDPVVRSKVQFTRSDKDLTEHIDATQLPKGMSGEDDWFWQYTDVVDGENYRSDDKGAKKQWLEKRAAARSELLDKTRSWVGSSDVQVEKERDHAVLSYRIVSIEADPYLRPRSVFHRHKNLHEDGTIEWEYRSSAGDQKFGVPIGTLKEMLAKGHIPTQPDVTTSAEQPSDNAFEKEKTTMETDLSGGHGPPNGHAAPQAQSTY